MPSSKSPKVDADIAVAVLAQKADLARAQIRGLVNSLPDSEAESILDVLDNPPEEESEQPGGFVWDELPAEVKNMIYRYVFVADVPIKPHNSWPNMPHRRRISKYGLGANFLRCSKAIYAEAHPILRMENTFEIGTQLRICLGEDSGKRNSSLIRKILIRPQKFSWTIKTLMFRLGNTNELTIVDDFAWMTCHSLANAEESAVRSFGPSQRRLSGFFLSTRDFFGHFSKVYYVVERKLGGRAKDAKNRIAFRFSVVHNPRPGADGMVDDTKDLWSVSNFDLKVLARNEYNQSYYSEYPNA